MVLDSATELALTLPSQMKQALNEKTKMLMRINLHSATIFMPKTFVNPHCPAVIIDLGQVRLSSNLTAREAAKKHIQLHGSGSHGAGSKGKESSEKSVADDIFYDTYSIDVSNVNAVVTHDRANWRSTVRWRRLLCYLFIDLVERYFDAFDSKLRHSC